MLGDHDSIATLAVSDLARSRQFYEGVLGIQPRRDGPEGVVYGAGSSSFLVYPSSYAGTNKATAISFQVDAGDFPDEIQGLRAKGIEFQTFEAEGLAWSDGVASYGDYQSAWFEDPDGNILNVETSGQ